MTRAAGSGDNTSYPRCEPGRGPSAWARFDSQSPGHLASPLRSRWGLRVPAASHFLGARLSAVAMLPTMLADDRRRAALGLVLVFVLMATVVLSGGCYARRIANRDQIPFTRFLEAVNDGDLVKTKPVTITSTTVSGAIRNGEREQPFVATIPPGFDRSEFVDELSRQGYEVDLRPS